MVKVLKAIVLCGAAALIATPAAKAQDDTLEGLADNPLSAEPASGVPPLSLIYNGTGCAEEGSLQATLIDIGHDGFPERLRLRFADYVARQGESVPPREFRKNCVIRMTLHQPDGWQVGIISAYFTGNAQLPAGVEARLGSIVSFPISDTATLQSTVDGPKTGIYRRGDALDYKDVIWSKCDTPSPLLGLNTQVYLTGDRTATASTSSTQQVYWLHWRRCP